MTRAHTARLMLGTELARDILTRCSGRARSIAEQTGHAPCLATVLLGDDAAARTHVQMRRISCAQAGLESRHVAPAASTTTAQLVEVISALSDDPRVHGILLQHPVPAHIDEREAFEAIAPEKDVEGVSMRSFAAMSLGRDGFVSCTPAAIMRLLAQYEVELSGKHAVVIGRSPILGKPVGMLLLGQHATVTFCHSRTVDLPSLLRTADLLVAAVGRPNLVQGSDVKPGAVVIDAGYNAGNVGDVDFEAAREHASLITPVPGGVGPMTIAVLLEQTVDAAARQLRVDPVPAVS